MHVKWKERVRKISAFAQIILQNARRQQLTINLAWLRPSPVRRLYKYLLVRWSEQAEGVPGTAALPDGAEENSKLAVTAVDSHLIAV